MSSNGYPFQQDNLTPQRASLPARTTGSGATGYRPQQQNQIGGYMRSDYTSRNPQEWATYGDSAAQYSPAPSYPTASSYGNSVNDTRANDTATIAAASLMSMDMEPVESAHRPQTSLSTAHAYPATSGSEYFSRYSSVGHNQPVAATSGLNYQLPTPLEVQQQQQQQYYTSPAPASQPYQTPGSNRESAVSSPTISTYGSSYNASTTSNSGYYKPSPPQTTQAIVRPQSRDQQRASAQPLQQRPMAHPLSQASQQRVRHSPQMNETRFAAQASQQRPKQSPQMNENRFTAQPATHREAAPVQKQPQQADKISSHGQVHQTADVRPSNQRQYAGRQSPHISASAHSVPPPRESPRQNVQPSQTWNMPSSAQQHQQIQQQSQNQQTYQGLPHTVNHQAVRHRTSAQVNEHQGYQNQSQNYQQPSQVQTEEAVPSPSQQMPQAPREQNLQLLHEQPPQAQRERTVPPPSQYHSTAQREQTVAPSAIFQPPASYQPRATTVHSPVHNHIPLQRGSVMQSPVQRFSPFTQESRHNTGRIAPAGRAAEQKKPAATKPKPKLYLPTLEPPKPSPEPRQSTPPPREPTPPPPEPRQPTPPPTQPSPPQQHHPVHQTPQVSAPETGSGTGLDPPGRIADYQEYQQLLQLQAPENQHQVPQPPPTPTESPAVQTPAEPAETTADTMASQVFTIQQMAPGKKPPVKRGPRAPKDPKAPKATRTPRAPKDPNAPKATRAPRKPKDPSAPKPPRAPRVRKPKAAATQPKSGQTQFQSNSGPEINPPVGAQNQFQATKAPAINPIPDQNPVQLEHPQPQNHQMAQTQNMVQYQEPEVQEISQPVQLQQRPEIKTQQKVSSPAQSQQRASSAGQVGKPAQQYQSTVPLTQQQQYQESQMHKTAPSPAQPMQPVPPVEHQASPPAPPAAVPPSQQKKNDAQYLQDHSQQLQNKFSQTPPAPPPHEKNKESQPIHQPSQPSQTSQYEFHQSQHQFRVTPQVPPPQPVPVTPNGQRAGATATPSSSSAFPQIPTLPPADPNVPLDSAVMEQHMRALVETMRFYQQKDPNTFHSVWESVRKESAPKPGITATVESNQPAQHTPTPAQRTIQAPSVEPSSTLQQPTPQAVHHNIPEKPTQIHQAAPEVQPVFSTAPDNPQPASAPVTQSSVPMTGMQDQQPQQPVPQGNTSQASPLPLQPKVTIPPAAQTTYATPMEPAPAPASTPQPTTPAQYTLASHKPGPVMTDREKQVVTRAASDYLQQITGKVVPFNQLLDLLDRTTNFVSLCEYFERELGMAFERGDFAKYLLNVVQTEKAKTADEAIKNPNLPQETPITQNEAGKLSSEVRAPHNQNPEGAAVLPQPAPEHSPTVSQQGVYGANTPPGPTVMTPARGGTRRPRGRPRRDGLPAGNVPKSTGTLYRQVSAASTSATASPTPVSTPTAVTPTPFVGKRPVGRPRRDGLPAGSVPKSESKVVRLKLPLKHMPPNAEASAVSSIQSQPEFPGPSEPVVVEDLPSPPAPFDDFDSPAIQDPQSGGFGESAQRSFTTGSSENQDAPEQAERKPSLVVKLKVSWTNQGENLARPENQVVDLTDQARPSPFAQAPADEVSILSKNSGEAENQVLAVPQFEVASEKPPSLPVSPEPQSTEIDMKEKYVPRLPWSGPVSQPLDRTKARRISKYSPTSIARNILIVVGRHPTEPGLNAHLQPLRENITLGINWKTDLASIRWDLLDPSDEPHHSPHDAGAEADDEADEHVAAPAPPVPSSTSQPNAPSTALSTPSTKIKRGRKPRGPSSATPHTTPRANPNTSSGSTRKAMPPNTTTPASPPPGGGGPRSKKPRIAGPAKSAAKINSKSFKKFACAWKDCRANLHNIEALTRHVHSVHAKINPLYNAVPCLWRDCMQPTSSSAHPIVYDFSNEDTWRAHMKLHLDEVQAALGPGPAALPSDSEHASDVDYLSDITPLARPAPEAYVFTPPPGFKATKQFRIAHNQPASARKGKKVSAAYEEELTRCRKLGVGMEGDECADLMKGDDGVGVDVGLRWIRKA